MSDEFEMKEEYDFSQAKSGPIVPPQANSTQITIRVDNKILDWLREQVQANGGGSYQWLINQILQQHIQSQQDWELSIRRVIREELQSAIQSPSSVVMPVAAE